MRKHAHGNVALKLPLFPNRVFLIEDYANCVALCAATAEAFHVVAQRVKNRLPLTDGSVPIFWDYPNLHLKAGIRFVNGLLLVPYLTATLRGN
jgi:hypothetical protein